MSRKFVLSRVATAAALIIASQFAQAAVPDASNPAVLSALGYLKGAGATLARVAEADAFNAKDLMVDRDGATHVRFDRLHGGLRVIGGDLVVHMDATGNLRDVSQTLSAAVNLSLQPRLSAEKAEAFALSKSGALDAKVERSELVIHAHDRAPALAHDVLVTGVKADGTPMRLHVIVDGHTRRVLDSFDEVQTVDALGTGNTLYSGIVPLHSDFTTGSKPYALKDLTRGGHYVSDLNNGTDGNGTLFTGTDADWGTGVKTARDTVAADAAYGQNETWDFYLTAFGRSGIANDGKGAFSRVHYSSNYDNAFWDDGCFCMTYGDGSFFNPLVSMDVAGHEMTHGVTSRTAGLIYSGESGGLNEGTSDIMGTMTEWFANNANDTPDYLIGEEIDKTGGALRYMYKPSIDGVSSDCWYPGVGNLDVHYSSGVANHFFFLLAEGTAGAGQPKSPTCVAGNTRVATGTGKLKGIGRDKAQQIWYRALTVYMTANTNFAAARVATVKAATDLYGAGSKEVKKVGKAWDAVNRP